MKCIWCDREHEGKSSSCDMGACVDSLQSENDDLRSRCEGLEANQIPGRCVECKWNEEDGRCETWNQYGAGFGRDPATFFCGAWEKSDTPAAAGGERGKEE